jgi:hypothetical protein
VVCTSFCLARSGVEALGVSLLRRCDRNTHDYRRRTIDYPTKVGDLQSSGSVRTRIGLEYAPNVALKIVRTTADFNPRSDIVLHFQTQRTILTFGSRNRPSPGQQCGLERRMLLVKFRITPQLEIDRLDDDLPFQIRAKSRIKLHCANARLQDFSTQQLIFQRASVSTRQLSTVCSNLVGGCDCVISHRLGRDAAMLCGHPRPFHRRVALHWKEWTGRPLSYAPFDDEQSCPHYR